MADFQDKKGWVLMLLLSLIYKRVGQSSRLSQTASAIGQAINAGDVHVTDDNVDDH